MERLKSNKGALILFISTIALIVLAVIGMVTLFTNMEFIKNAVKESIVNNNSSATQDEINLAINIAVAGVWVSIVIEAIVTLFVALCGFKCSLKGQWRIGAIVFGVLYVISQISGLFGSNPTATIVINVISLVASIGYLAGAVLAKKE